MTRAIERRRFDEEGNELELDDEVIELGLTPNRGDLLSMIGVAYEVSAVFNRPIKPLVYELLEDESLNNKELVDVKIETDKCLLYYAKVIKDVKIKKIINNLLHLRKKLLTTKKK